MIFLLSLWLNGPLCPWQGSAKDTGEVVAWTLDTLPDHSLAGITWARDKGKFYMVNTREAKVLSFPPQPGPESLQVAFSLPNLFNDGLTDWWWGIAWDPGGFFWMSVLSALMDSAAICRVDTEGKVTDTFFLEPPGEFYWIAGLDLDPMGRLWAVQVGAGDSLLALDTSDLGVLDMAKAWTWSMRGVAFLGYMHQCQEYDTILRVYVSGWNDTLQLYLLDGYSPEHTVLWAGGGTPFLADLDVWEPPSPDTSDTVWAFATNNDVSNTVYRINLGFTWGEWGLCSDTSGVLEDISLVAGRLVGPGEIEIYDISGRKVLVGRSPLGLSGLPRGVYLARSEGGASLVFVR